MDGVDVLLVIAKTVAAFVLWLVSTALLIWGERRLLAKMQTRIGPNRLGPMGILQTLADGAKLFFKEDITPRNVDRFVYLSAPMASAMVALLTFAVVPFGGTFTVAGRPVTLQVWDPDIGLLWVLAMSSLGVYGIVLAGWSSGSKYPLLGGVRSSAQMISYELAMGLGLAAVFIYTGSLRSSEIVARQAEPLIGSVPAWNIIPMAPAFVLFFAAIVAETQRHPFDLPEAEGELVAGFHTEYTGAKFAMFFLAEFMNIITMSAVTVTMFLGGPAGPLFGPGWLQALLPTVYFLLKTFVFVFVFVWLRGTLPRLRYDRLMDLGWKVMLPLGMVWALLTGVSVVLGQTADRSTVLRYAGIGIAVALVLYLAAPLFGRRQVEPGGGGGEGLPAGGTGGDQPGGRAAQPPGEADAPQEPTGEKIEV
ncbi:MAG TPA: NADH-quinone oxidoreductase subunit NuoH [Egibacteraceae bacterium]|nr:NADH-quinone oxidoreductase subunit NuoH [Egibacteraceae bacterium]